MSKQLSLSERTIIERMLAQNYTFASEIVYVLILESMAVMAIVVSFAQKVFPVSRFVLLIPLLTALSTINHPIPVMPATLLSKNPASIIMLITLLTELMQLI